MDRHSRHKALIAPMRRALYDFEPGPVRKALSALATPDAVFRLCHPLGEVTGPDALCDDILGPLAKAVPDLERRDYIVVAGPDDHGHDWVGCAGYYTGAFMGPWLDIPPTGHQVHMRFHEFYRFAEDRIVEMQAIWDIPEVMMQARAWPMAQSLGREWNVPGPATCDGLVPGPHDAAAAEASKGLVLDMLDHMIRHPSQGGPEVMEMPRFWHERMSWYGPAGIGTGRGIAGFRHRHQIPFLQAMPDRGKLKDAVTYHFFGDGPYAAVTGWPNMIQTISHDGWLGIAPAGQQVTMRSLDFWRIETGRIRENWVMVDLLDVYRQLGVDVFARLRAFNTARVPGRVPDFGEGA